MAQILLKDLLVRSLSGEKIDQVCAAKILVFYSSVELFLSKSFGLLFPVYHLALCLSLRKSSCMPLNGASENGKRVNTFSQHLSEEILLSY